MTFASQISREFSSCNETMTSGGKVFLHLLTTCDPTPITETIVVGTTITIVDTQANLQLLTSTYSPQELKAGSVIYFPDPGASITLAEDFTITDTPQVVNIESPPALQIDAGKTMIFYVDTFKLLSLTDLPFNFSSTTQERVDLSTIQEGELIKGVGLEQSLTCIANTSDDALWSVVFPASTRGRFVYALTTDATEKVVFGKAIVKNYQENGQVDELKRPNFTLRFVNADYSVFAPFDYLNPSDQTLVNDELSKIFLPRF